MKRKFFIPLRVQQIEKMCNVSNDFLFSYKPSGYIRLLTTRQSKVKVSLSRENLLDSLRRKISTDTTNPQYKNFVISRKI